MNSRQKAKKNHIRRKLEAAYTCPECGEKGAHYVEPTWCTYGFWTCDKFYDPVTLRRLDIPVRSAPAVSRKMELLLG